MKATSVGFLRLAWSFAKGTDGVGGIDFHEAELLEFSIVPVPANADCTLNAGQSCATLRSRARALGYTLSRL